MKKNKTISNSTKLDEKEFNLIKKLLTEYMGEGNEIFFVRNFSFPGFIFGSVYLLFRKLYMIGLPLLFLNIALCINLENYIGYIILFITHFIIGCTFNKIYIKHSLKMVNKINDKNTGIKEETLLEQCIKKGGFTVSKVIISVILAVGLIFALKPSEKFLKDNLFKEEEKSEEEKLLEELKKLMKDEEKKDDINSDLDDELNQEYDGLLSYDSEVVMKKEFDITIPKEFVSEDDDDISYSLETDSDEYKVSFDKLSNYTDIDLLLNGMKKYYNTEDNIETKNINGLIWKSLKYSLINDTIVSVTKKNDRLYILKFEYSDSVEGLKYYNSIINSIKAK